MSDNQAGRILAVDDNVLGRKLLARALEEQGHSVVTAANGQQALELLTEKNPPPFDLILLDILMPEMDGYQMLETLKQHPLLQHLPVIMISAIDEMDSVIRCIEAGATDYLPKPFNPALLRARINASLASKRLHDAQQQYLEETQRYLEQIQIEQEKAEALLLNILPASIAERLKQSPGVIADSFVGVTVLFADLVGFTPLAASMAPEAAVELLDDIFTEFDSLADRHGLEKIKTIGDAYMAVSGLPNPRDDHAGAAADMALEMQAALAKIRQRQKIDLHVRIGLNSGPVVAGIIGRKKFTYDLWGDTVNVASRMESHGVIDSVQVSADTYDLLQSGYEFQTQPPMQIKGKGEMITYLLVGRGT
jgi:class 3 adenylate cyclase